MEFEEGWHRPGSSWLRDETVVPLPAPQKTTKEVCGTDHET